MMTLIFVFIAMLLVMSSGVNHDRCEMDDASDSDDTYDTTVLVMNIAAALIAAGDSGGSIVGRGGTVAVVV